MAQTYTVNCFQSDHTGQSDLQNMENNFEALKTCFSGSGAPAVDVKTGQLWFDTNNKVLKVRNNANSAWLSVMAGNSSNKIWMYSNSATDGWTIDATVTDRVIALKGGAQAYNIAGGNTGGTWTQPSHTLVANEIPAHTHDCLGGSAASDGTKFELASGATNDTIQTESVGGGGAHNHGSTYRPAAAVGTLQYPTA